VALALAGTAISIWSAWHVGAGQVSGGDYGRSYAPSMSALLAGHLHAFFANVPPNGAGGSVLLRAPFALIGKVLVGDQITIFRFGALACLLTLVAVGIWVAADWRRRGISLPTRVGFLGLCACTPALLESVPLGHPEEPLGAALAVAAVLAAGAKRPLLAGGLLGAAVINKPWGVLAIAPVLLCSEGARVRALLPAATIVGCWLLAAILLDPAQLGSTVNTAQASIVAHPQDLWWPLTHTVGLYALPPAFLAAHARQIAVALGLAVAAALALRGRRLRVALDTNRCLALLALGFALRCLLEPSAHAYYQLPLLIAFAAWEGSARGSVSLSLAATVLLALDFGRLNEAAAIVPFLVYLAVLLPLCGLLLAGMFGEGRRVAAPSMPGRRSLTLQAGPHHL
jgi:hypothetical protein